MVIEHPHRRVWKHIWIHVRSKCPVNLESGTYMRLRSMAYVGKNTIYVCQNACHSSQISLSLFNKTVVIYNILQLSLSLFLPKYTIFWTQMYISKMNVFLSDHNLGLPCVWAERLLIGTWLEGWWGERQSPYRQYGLPLRRERIEGTFQKNYFGNKCSSPFFWKKTVYQVKASL